MNGKRAPCALVTGGGVRIGRAIAEHLGDCGWNVAVHCHRHRGEADQVAAGIVAGGGKAVVLPADLSDPRAPAELVTRAVAALGPLHLLINNAAIFEPDWLTSLDVESWDRHIALNLRAPVLLAQAFAAQLADGGEGNIVNLLDQAVAKLTPDHFSYTISKVGLTAANDLMAQSLAPRIRVNAIGPGPTLPSPEQTAADFAAEAAATPLGHGVELRDICTTLDCILATPAMTGQHIILDSGQHLT